jgi:pimeloyl-ACP methyl ester carboxylesterase
MIESLQGRLIFGRPKLIRPLPPGPHAGSYRVEAHRLNRGDGVVLEGWSAAPLAGPAGGVMLYFGGRNENVAWAADMASFNRGLAVYAFNYRGFGTSTGRASERRAKEDAQAVHEFVAARETSSDVTVIGRSLGTAIALWLARRIQPRRLVLLSPFESVRGVVRSRPLGWAVAGLTKQRFACDDLAAAYAGRALVLLAEYETSIPQAQSRRLAARMPLPPQIEVVAGTTHQSLPRSAGAQHAMARFIAGGGHAVATPAASTGWPPTPA